MRKLIAKFSLRLEIGNRIHPHRSEKESCQGLLREYEGGEPVCKVSRSLDQGSHESFYRHINGGVALNGVGNDRKSPHFLTPLTGFEKTG